jgi:acyl-CoA dehydrogenase
MMSLTNLARYAIAMMGVGCARRALAESLLYARARHAWGEALIDKPLMQRKLAELIVDVEAAQALVFDGSTERNRRRDNSGPATLRLGAPLAKLKAARLGITAASDAIEVHGGNGYIETWPLARILRDSQVNTLWEGPDNILCLDVRRGIERENGDVALLERIREAIGNSDGSAPAVRALEGRASDLSDAIEAWKKLDGQTAEARLYPLAHFMIDVYAGALLAEQASFEQDELGSDRKSLVLSLYADRYLSGGERLRGIDREPSEAMARFDELQTGALIENRS